ncbi:GNAT family N-acetyltransferase [Kitasatospora sp. NPDC049258]|uniref:GNAT family N-acetyltransferase n=1 Tax=Kitasatospora sp. NPDC049258 TaxID=3155394 RepID=UPI0034214BA2
MSGTPDRANAPEVRIRPWEPGDLALLHRVNTPVMKNHVGGPETAERVLVRHRRYLDFVAAGTGRMFAVLLGPELRAVGTVGYAEREWRGERGYEMGWNVLPPFQGRGVAAAAVVAAVARARSERTHRHLLAFPSVDNPPSNAVCRKAGFSFVAACDFEFPPGRLMRSNEWRLDLTAP